MVTPMKGGFKFNLKPPTQKPGTFTDKECHGMSTNLAKVGLSCSANTPDKMIGYTKKVTFAINDGHANLSPRSDVASLGRSHNRG